MRTYKFLIRIFLFAIWLQYSLSKSENEYLMKISDIKSKFSLKDVEKTKRDSRVNYLHEETQNEFDHERNRRQMGCCTVTNCANFVNSYRTMDGTCNNLNNPCWGSAGIPFVRILNPSYANVTNCCNGSTSASCFNINTTGDSFYNQFNVKCLPFVRSTPTTCLPGSPREQTNARTAFLDMSQVYGSSNAEMINLRIPNSYLLKFDPGENQNCLANDPNILCRTFLPTRNNAMTGNIEFFAGDARLEQQPGLTSMQAIFARLHNGIATILANNNGNCPDKIFQETRKIMGGIMQQITYNEFLPIVVGPTMMAHYSLNLGSFSGYDPSMNPSTPNEFSAASFRFGHSLVRSLFTLPSTTVDLGASFNNHARTTIVNTFPSHFMRGIAADSSEPMDHIVNEAVRNRLFARAPFTNGEDLYSRNIQRGRDHGLPSYRNFINNYYPGTVNSFSDLTGLMPSQVISTLQNLYSNQIDQLDLFPAAIAEGNLPGALLGPTFANMNAEYFQKLKFGDRYWFENGIFTNNQLNAIYETKLSGIICVTTDAGSIQKWSMLPENSATGNPNTNCNILKNEGVMNGNTLKNYWSNIC